MKLLEFLDDNKKPISYSELRELREEAKYIIALLDIQIRQIDKSVDALQSDIKNVRNLGNYE